MKAQIRRILLVLAALLALFAAYTMLVYTVPHIQEDLVEIGIRPSLLAAVARTMSFAAWSMAGFSAIIVAAAVSDILGRSINRPSLIISGLLFLAFGVVAVYHHGNVHMYGYVAIGLFSAVAGLL